MSRLKSAHDDGYLERPITFNTLLGYMAKPELTQVLHELLIKSSLGFVKFTFSAPVRVVP